MDMRAVVVAEFGGPEVLRMRRVPVPVPGPGEVRVRVRAAGVMPFDAMVRGGGGPAPRPPFTPGNEFAGIVDELGDAAGGFAVGDEVLGFGRLWAYAEYIVVGADQIMAKPPAMPWEVAGGFSGNGQGAHLALEAMRVVPGDVVVINGAAGAMGTFTVQLALAQGAARVIGTASPVNHDHLRTLGAVPVAYGEGLADRLRAAVPGGADAALDLAGGPGVRDLAAVVKDPGRVITAVGGDEADQLGLRSWSGERTAARLADLVGHWVSGAVAIHLRAVFPLERVADAHRLVETGHGRGKVVLTVP